MSESLGVIAHLLAFSSTPERNTGRSDLCKLRRGGACLCWYPHELCWSANSELGAAHGENVMLSGSASCSTPSSRLLSILLYHPS